MTGTAKQSDSSRILRPYMFNRFWFNNGVRGLFNIGTTLQNGTIVSFAVVQEVSYATC